MPDQEWVYPSAFSECCYKGNAELQRRSVHIPWELLEFEDAVSLFDSTNLGSFAWGDHKAVSTVPFSDPPEFELVDSFPIEAGYHFEELDTLFAYPQGFGKAEIRYEITFPQGEWREIDGEGIRVKIGRRALTFEFDESEGYELTDTSYSTVEYEIAVSVGATSVFTPATLFTSTGTEGLRVELYPPAAPPSFQVSGSSGGVYDSPPQSVPGAGNSLTELCMFYSEKRGGVSTDLTLTISCTSATEDDPVVVEFDKRTRDLTGAIVSGGSDSVELTSAAAVEVVVDAPEADGRTYCYNFRTAAVTYGLLPLITGLQVCVDPPD